VQPRLHDKSVVICGMFRQDFEGLDESSIKAESELWVVNDWYTFLPFECPDRIYNIHRPPFTHPDTKHRFIDWKRRYNQAVKLGSRVMVTEKIPGIIGQRWVKTDALTNKFPTGFLQCSISTMIGEAILEGFSKIKLLGVRLRDDEFTYQIYGIRGMLNLAKAQGIKVDNLRDSEWQKNNRCVVDWGASRAILPYWMRECPVQEATVVIA